ncbi:uncharacterized protein LOC143354928 [Halictus rubicundus]|uniref:uncharacterized protein LOC143354928 n=1 Tax=Halictus rubicundus TaxID=77578 RepID=UPI004036520F
MKKFFAILCVTLLVISLVESCKPPGLLCSDDKDCCAPLICNPWAGRCTKKLTPSTTTGNANDPAEAPADGQI